MARPKKQIDEKLVHDLAAINCTMDEIAAVAGCSKDTLERRFAAIIKEGREQGKASIRRLQYELAKKGNATMLIWLGKQLLGQREKIDQNINQKSIVNLHEQVVREIESGNTKVD